MRTPKRGDIRRECGDAYYNRGVSYHRHGLVLELLIKRETAEDTYFVAHTKGSKENVYQQEIHLTGNDSRVDIDGACSCPVFFNCKHVVAACLEFMQKKNQAEAPQHDFFQWLAKLENPAKTSSMPESQNGDFLGFLLKPGTKSGEIEVEYKVLRRLKKGSFGKPRNISHSSLTNSYYAPSCVSASDREIIDLVEISRGRTWNRFPLHGGAGGMALKLMAETGRCFWKIPGDDTRLNWAAEPRELVLSWEHDNSGLLRLQTNLEGGGFPVLVEPACFIDPDNGSAGHVNSGGFSTAQVEQLLKAPPLSGKDALNLSRELLLHHPTLALPPPVALETREIHNVAPIPVLTLFRDQLSQDQAHMMQLRFSYAEQIIHPLPVAEHTSLETSSGFISIHRQLPDEAAALLRLEKKGIQWASSGNENKLAGYIPASSRLESAGLWKTVLDELLPQLKEEGWIIETDESFRIGFHEVEQWRGALEEDDDGWFSMSLEVEIEGKPMALLPLLGPALETYTIDELPETLHIPLGDHQYLSVPGEKIRPWMETIIELFNQQPPKEGKLRLSLFEAARIADLENSSSLTWQGGERLQELGKRLRDFEQLEPVDPPGTFTGTLRDYQKTGYDWLHFLREYGLGGILADDMGLGKTVQTLAFLANQKARGELEAPALVIAPTSLMSNWRREAQVFTPELNVLVLHGPDRHEHFAQIHSNDLILTTYPLLPRDQEKLLDREYSILVLDEAQVVKNPKAQAARIVRLIRADQRLCLTGTPMENHLGELWTQFDFLMPGFLGDQSSFKRLYRTPIEKHGDMGVQARLARRIAPFMLRRRKDEVEKDLPEKTEIIRSIPLGKTQAALYESIRLTMEKKVRDTIASKGLARSHITILDALLKLRQVCCDPRLLKLRQAQKVQQSAKLEMLMELLPEMLEEGRKILLFSQFTSMLSLIQKELDSRHIRYTKLTGQTRKRDQAIERFVNGAADVFLISLKAGGVGLNLTAADTVIFFDPWWNPAAEAQAMDRAHRIGQDKPVFVYKLLTENTVEEKILALQEKKKALAEGVYRQGKKGETFQLSDTDLEVLFEPLDTGE